MKPKKNDEHAVVELVDVLLREGAVLQADVVVTVADVPLIGINLQAAIAGMATMTDYGLLREYDETIRERARERTGQDPHRQRTKE
jgi:hypothetical protein